MGWEENITQSANDAFAEAQAEINRQQDAREADAAQQRRSADKQWHVDETERRAAKDRIERNRKAKEDKDAREESKPPELKTWGENRAWVPARGVGANVQYTSTATLPSLLMSILVVVVAWLCLVALVVVNGRGSQADFVACVATWSPWVIPTSFALLALHYVAWRWTVGAMVAVRCVAMLLTYKVLAPLVTILGDRVRFRSPPSLVGSDDLWWAGLAVALLAIVVAMFLGCVALVLYRAEAVVFLGAALYAWWHWLGMEAEPGGWFAQVSLPLFGHLQILALNPVSAPVYWLAFVTGIAHDPEISYGDD